MYSTCILFKHTYFMLLRSLQDINQPYIKCTENALFIHDDDDDGSSIVVIVVVVSDDDDFWEWRESSALSEQEDFLYT